MKRVVKTRPNKYYRVDVIMDDEIVSVCTTTNKNEAEKQYKIWSETHFVKLTENELVNAY